MPAEPPVPSLRDVYADQLARVRADPAAAAATDFGAARGWLLHTGVVDLLEPFLTWLPTDDGDLARFGGLDGTTAAVLLERLPAAELDDRQNDAPTLGTLLTAAARHPENVELHGYLVGPARTDERLTVEGLCAYGAPDVEISEGHGPGCGCAELWAWVVAELGIDDAGRMPDDIRAVAGRRAGDERAWCLWWD